MRIEIKVREVTRYIVTEYAEHDGGASSQCLGEFSHSATAERVAMAVARSEAIKAENAQDDSPIVHPDTIVDHTGRLWRLRGGEWVDESPRVNHESLT